MIVFQIDASKSARHQAVWRDALMGSDWSRFDPAGWAPLYDRVASVDSDDLEEAFELMNLWNDQSRVEMYAPTRSMSVGDVIIMNKEAYFCDTFGFIKLNVPAQAFFWN